jgi:CRISPR-associated protein Cas4
MKLSASLYNKFLVCPKNADLSLNPELKHLNKSSLRAALGNVSHKLAEESMGLSLDLSTEQISSWFDSNWESCIQAEYESLLSQWHPNVVPKPNAWAGYFATRSAIKTLVMKNSRLLPSKDALHSKPSVDPMVFQKANGKRLELPLIEQYLESEELGIVGKPDYVFFEGDTATIYDYKFGRDQVDLEKHKMQMHFYALLVQSLLEVTVGRMAIVASANKVWEIPIDSKYLSVLKKEILRVREALLTHKVAAIPSVTNCTFCPYKPICEPFKEAKIETHPGRPMAIIGNVSRLRHIDIDKQEIRIATGIGASVREVVIFGVPGGYELEVGSSVCISDGLQYRDENYIGFGWNSRISVLV